MLSLSRPGKPMLITLSGIDCAGKSTQLERLKEALAARGLRTSMMWLRPGYSPQMDAARLLVRRLTPRALPTTAEPRRREQAFARPGVTRTWITMALVDLLTQYGAQLRLALTCNDVVICDRYVHDAALDLTLRFPRHAGEIELALRAIERVLPAARLQLLLTLSHEEMLRRMELKREPFPDPPDVRAKRFEAYMRLGERPDFVVIDANADVDSVHATIFAHVAPLLDLGG